MTEMQNKQGRTTVLVVDDRESTRLLVRAALEQAGFVVEEAHDGESALSAFLEYQPDIVLLDVVMPGMDGFTTCAEIRKLPGGHSSPIIMTTGTNDIDGINRAYEVGATDFVTKPINYVILTHRLRYMVRAIQNQIALAEQAIRDPLTDLYNRRYFRTRIQEELTRAERDQEIVAVFLCNIDNFKSINESLGHQKGDTVLKAVAQGVLDTIRGYDQVFRWGGDEIVVIVPKFELREDLSPANRIRSRVEGISKMLSLGVDVDVSIGISLFPEHGSNPEALIHQAEQALFIAKKGKSKVQIGEEEYHLNEDTVKAVFQPVVDLNTREIIGYEALTRDLTGELNVFELFNKYNSVGKLKELKGILFKKQIKMAKHLGLNKVFVNADFNLLDYLGPIEKPSGLDVIIEISEVEALLDVKKNLDAVRKWRELGYKFAIDDFGAGFISLPFIAFAIPEYIKLDRSTMLLSVSSDKLKDFLHHLTAALSKYTSEGIIAEGIEEEQELQRMKEIGIPLGQGYLLGRPEEILLEKAGS